MADKQIRCEGASIGSTMQPARREPREMVGLSPPFFFFRHGDVPRIESSARVAWPQNSSVAGLLLTTEVMIAEAPKDEGHSHGAPGGMGGMGGMVM